MVEIKENFTEWRKKYEAADEPTKTLMKLDRDERRANKEKEEREKTRQAIDNLSQIGLESVLKGHDSEKIAEDIRTVIWASREYLKSEQVRKWHTQLFNSDWKMLHEFIAKQAKKISSVQDIHQLDDAMTHLQWYAEYYTEGLLSSLPSGFDCLAMLARESSENIRKGLKTMLAKEHIYIKESGEMVIDEKARAKRLEPSVDPSE